MSEKDNSKEKPQVCRRGFIKSATTAVALGSAMTAPALLPKSADAAPTPVPGGGGGDDRAMAAAAIRVEAAQAQLDYTNGLDPQENNGDDDRYSDENYYASFTKTLPHNDLGEADASAYESLLNAVATGVDDDFDDIPLDTVAGRRLANPQGGLRFVFAGLDGHATRINPAPTFRSPEAAVEMTEVYWLAITRDIPYAEYGSNKFMEEAIKDMVNIKQTTFPVFQNGNLTTDTIFRGETPGDLVGPYISQFLWQDVPYGLTDIEQRYISPKAGTDFMTSEEDWLFIQRGGRPQMGPDLDKTPRYIINNRDLGEYVHEDVLFQAYFNALLIILNEFGRPALDVRNPYGISIFNQDSFTSLGGPWFIDLLTQAGNLALNGAWYQKWFSHRRLRPEAYAGRIHHHLEGNATYELPSEILSTIAVRRINAMNGGTYFLPMQYEEGSPTHPSYVAGHAAVAGACCTVLKAICNENFINLEPVVPTADGLSLVPYQGDTLTLGGEINKLAANISLGRDAAGVHYRTDGIEGMLLGEQQAIGLLRDYSTGVNESRFGGFNFTGFLGNNVTIEDGEVTST